MRALTLCLLLGSVVGCAAGASSGASAGGHDACGNVKLLRDAASGTCHAVGPCDDSGHLVPAPDEPACFDACDGRGEAECIATANCRPAYAIGMLSGSTGFLGCWATAPSSTIHTGSCAGLDAYACSRHDNCAAYYTPSAADGAAFDHCAPDSPSS